MINEIMIWSIMNGFVMEMHKSNINFKIEIWCKFCSIDVKKGIIWLKE